MRVICLIRPTCLFSTDMLADHLSLLSLIACNNLIIVSRSNHNDSDTFVNSHNLNFVHYTFHFL